MKFSATTKNTNLSQEEISNVSGGEPGEGPVALPLWAVAGIGVAGAVTAQLIVPCGAAIAVGIINLRMACSMFIVGNGFEAAFRKSIAVETAAVVAVLIGLRLQRPRHQQHLHQE